MGCGNTIRTGRRSLNGNLYKRYIKDEGLISDPSYEDIKVRVPVRLESLNS